MEDSDELQEQLLALYDAMSSGDAGRVEAFYSLAPEACFVGTDEAEFWTDSARHNADVRSYFDGSRGRLRWTATDALARADFGTGWSFDRPIVRFPDGSEMRLRVTLVWQREPDGWQVVHSHASVGG